jgi:hypothetical protein
MKNIIKSESCDNNKLKDNNNKLDDIDNNLNKFDKMSIDIKKLLSELESIGSEKEKDDFIKNYSRIREQIKLVDSILDNDNDNICNYNEFESKTISELFEMIELNETKIFDSDNLTIGELKYLTSVCDILEKKINDDTMSIMEIK